MNDGIRLQNPNRYPINRQRLVQATRATLASHSDEQDASLCIALTDADAIKELNSKYAFVDAPTDVLSFPANPLPHAVGETGKYLGDIVIAHDYVSAHAGATDAALDDILCLLVIHGTLHLLGFTHDTAAAKDRMWAAQDAALRLLNIDPAVVQSYGNIEDD